MLSQNPLKKLQKVNQKNNLNKKWRKNRVIRYPFLLLFIKALDLYIFGVIF